MPRQRTLLLVLGPVALILAALAAAQVVLPGVAEDRVRDELRRDGRVEAVDVEAFPAVKLLLGRADEVTVRLSEARADTGRISDLAARAADVGRLDARVDRFTIGGLVVRDAQLRKRDQRLTAAADVGDADIEAALPPQVELEPISAVGGELLLEATASAFGFSADIRARLSARTGALVIAPETDLPFVGSLATLTVFSDPRIVVTGVGAEQTPGGYRVTADARLRTPRR